MEAGMAALAEYQISNFFSQSAPVTQQDCNQEAERIVGMSVQPTPIQGGDSYTVVSQDEARIVQFRKSGSAMNMDLLECVEQAYEGFTPRHVRIGNLEELHIYTMGNIGGISIYLAREQLFQNNFQLLRQTVSDFARFFASAWNKTPSHLQCPSRDFLLRKYSSELTQLQQGLPERFRPTLDRLIPMLPSLLEDKWPLVPNHIDLLENNIHVDPETGHITGICDWKDTVIGPFGMSLGFLETMLGLPSLEVGLIYHECQQELRDLFWEVFYEAMGEVTEEQKALIEVARLIGLFLQHGIGWDNDLGAMVPADEGDHNLLHLEAVTLKLWDQTGQ